MEKQRFERVADLLEQQNLGLEWLIHSRGIERRVAEAIARQRYQPTPERRRRIAQALGIQSSNTEVELDKQRIALAPGKPSGQLETG